MGPGPAASRLHRRRCRALATHTDKLATDLKIVERYQNVCPTKQQTGTLFGGVPNATANFKRVALYFANSLLRPTCLCCALPRLP
ncbi:MAG TPA: hypothetical protein VKB88_12290 [Bryobacteraceae bacterium]|nr:hypothetical protein [Bryobacteraceae bacterium]